MIHVVAKLRRRTHQLDRVPRFKKLILNRSNDLHSLDMTRLRFLLGWHFTGLQLIEHTHPTLPLLRRFKIQPKIMQSDLPLLLLHPVTSRAILCQK